MRSVQDKFLETEHGSAVVRVWVGEGVVSSSAPGCGVSFRSDGGVLLAGTTAQLCEQAGPLSLAGVNCVGPPAGGYFSIVNTTALPGVQSRLHLQVQRNRGYRGSTASLMWINPVLFKGQL